mgnify:CR=1 FL=1
MHGTETILGCDVDQDGRTDILANLYNRSVPVHYFAYVGLENSESGFEKRILGHHGRGHGCGYGDLNIDGRPDFIWGHAHDFGLYCVEQTRDSAGRVAWIEHLIDDTYSQIHCPAYVDMDGDGTKDIVAGKRYRGHAGGDPGANEPLCLFWYKVTKGPAPRFTKYILSYDENIGTGMNFKVIDIDFDGDKDIVTPGKSGLYLFTNTTR